MDTLIIVIFIVLLCGLAIGFVTIARQLRELHLSMNSRLDQLLKRTGELARAEGFKAGQQNHLDALRDAAAGLDSPPR